MNHKDAASILLRCCHPVGIAVDWLRQQLNRTRGAHACIMLVMIAALGALVSVASSESSMSLVLLCFWPFVIVAVAAILIVLANCRKRVTSVLTVLVLAVGAFVLLFTGSTISVRRTEQRTEQRLIALSCALLSENVSPSVLSIADKSGFAFGGLCAEAPAVSAVAVDNWLMGASVELKLMDGRRLRMQWSSTSTDRPVLEAVAVAR